MTPSLRRYLTDPAYRQAGRRAAMHEDQRHVGNNHELGPNWYDDSAPWRGKDVEVRQRMIGREALIKWGREP